MFISADTRVKALKHVIDNFLQIHQRVGIYTDDIDKLLEEHIDYERSTYILDKPSIGLHSRDTERLIDLVKCKASYTGKALKNKL